MSDSSHTLNQKLFSSYRDYFEVAERKRRWNVFDDIPWDKLDAARNSDRKATRIETFCAEEMYVPDYGSKGLELVRPIFGTAWFQMCWSYEEAKHGLAFREYLIRSGLRSEAQIAALEADLFSREWNLPFQTRRQMACYGALQEAATYLAYKAQKDLAREEGDEVLEAIFTFVSRDEAAHAGFYRAIIQLELEADRNGTLRDLAHVIAEFKMPGDGLIPNYQERLRDSGAGISPRLFVEHALLPLIKGLKTSRAELKAVQQITAPQAAQLIS
ncbi:MAG: acyl-ACP desaturase [Chthoniobacterales bacterium]